MSTTLSTTDLVNVVREACPFGISTNYALARINEAFRYISQKAPFVWEQKRTTLTISTSATTVALPSDMAPGKPKALGGPSSNQAAITYMPYDQKFLDQFQFYSTGTALSASPGMYSAWSYVTAFTAAANGTLDATLSSATVTYASGTPFAAAWIGQTIVINSIAYTITANPTPTTLTISPVMASATATYAFATSAFYSYLAYLAPTAAAPASGSYSLPFIYHAKPSVLAMSTSLFFPSPDEFDDVIANLAIAQTKERYQMNGWADTRQQAEMCLAPLIDVYKSTNIEIGLRDQTAVTSEANAKRAE